MRVESSLKPVLEARPIHLRCDETVRGHVWCSSVALRLRVEVQRRLAEAPGRRAVPEWADVVRDMEALVETEREVQGKRFAVRGEAREVAAQAFRACGVASPPLSRPL